MCNLYCDCIEICRETMGGERKAGGGGQTERKNEWGEAWTRKGA